MFEQMLRAGLFESSVTLVTINEVLADLMQKYKSISSGFVLSAKEIYAHTE